MPAIANIPTLDTDRLALRPHTAADFDDCLALWSDARVVRYIGGAPQTPPEVWARLLRYAGLWPLLGFGYWVVHERASGRFVGEVGLADFRRGMLASLDGVPEAGWVIAPWAHGRGFATEAVRAVLDWSDTQLDARRTVCLIDPENAASIRVATKCGYRDLTRVSFKGSETLVLERERREPA